MYTASAYFNSFFPAKPLDLSNKNKKYSIKIPSASFSFILFIHNRAVTRVGITGWIWASEQPLRQCLPMLLSSLVSASPFPQGGGCEVPCSIMHSAFLPKEKKLEKQPVRYSGQPQGVQWAGSGLGALSSAPELPQDVCPGARSAQPSTEHLLLAGSLRAQSSSHTTGTPPSPPSVPKGSTMNCRNKNKAKNISIWDILRISENTFNAFWCDHISQLMCVISLFFSLSASPSRNSFCTCALLFNPVAFALFYCQVSLHQPQLFYHSCCYQALWMFLTCFFLTEETLCKIHFLCSFTIN